MLLICAEHDVARAEVARCGEAVGQRVVREGGRGDQHDLAGLGAQPAGLVIEGLEACTRDFVSLALGGEIEIADLAGKPVTLSIPAGIQSGRQLRQRGAGMPVLQGRGRGDLVVELLVETPTKLTKEQRSLLEQFRDTETGAECPESRGFFDKIKEALGG